jgi:alkylation response protein AidB-like acyl-CoA dehydrogenase
MGFVLPPPQLGNQYAADRALRSYLARVLPEEMRSEIEAELEAMGALAGGELYRLQRADRKNEPRLVPSEAGGGRAADRVEVTPLWREARRIAAERGLVATAYERRHGAYSRVHQFALAYLFTPSSDLYSCPLATTDGAAKALIASGNSALIERALPHLTSRDPREFWTSGQWMAEAAGGSGVEPTATVAHREGGRWRLHGRKRCATVIGSQMALVLARPAGNSPGAEGLALFYLETRDGEGRPNGIRVERLQDTLGARKVPTAVLALEGAVAELVTGADDGMKAIAPMLGVARAWSAVCACALARRGLALARDYARQRVAFGTPLAAKPLHLDTLAGLEAELAGALHLAFYVVELMGREEAGRASAEQQSLLRLLTPLAKLLTAKQAVHILSEAIEAFGETGYLEDSGIPVLLRDAQALPIWEGTTDALALEALQGLGAGAGLAVLEREIGILLRGVREPDLVKISALAEGAVQRARDWLERAKGAQIEAGARRFATTLGRAMELALLARHAQWSLLQERDPRTRAAARRLAAHGASAPAQVDAADSRRLVPEEEG